MEPFIDKTTLLARVDNDIGLLEEIVEIFFRESPILMQEIQEAIQEKDAKALMKSSHALKGSASNFSAITVTDLAYQLETMGRIAVLSNASDTYQNLVHEVDRLQIELQQLIEGLKT